MMFLISHAQRASARIEHHTQGTTRPWAQIFVDVTGICGETTSFQMHVESSALAWAERFVANVNAANLPAGASMQAAE